MKIITIEINETPKDFKSENMYSPETYKNDGFYIVKDVSKEDWLVHIGSDNAIYSMPYKDKVLSKVYSDDFFKTIKEKPLIVAQSSVTEELFLKTIALLNNNKYNEL